MPPNKKRVARKKCLRVLDWGVPVHLAVVERNWRRKQCFKMHLTSTALYITRHRPRDTRLLSHGADGSQINLSFLQGLPKAICGPLRGDVGLLIILVETQNGSPTLNKAWFPECL